MKLCEYPQCVYFAVRWKRDEPPRLCLKHANYKLQVPQECETDNCTYLNGWYQWHSVIDGRRSIVAEQYIEGIGNHGAHFVAKHEVSRATGVAPEYLEAFQLAGGNQMAKKRKKRSKRSRKKARRR